MTFFGMRVRLDRYQYQPLFSVKNYFTNDSIKQFQIGKYGKIIHTFSYKLLNIMYTTYKTFCLNTKCMIVFMALFFAIINACLPNEKHTIYCTRSEYTVILI